MKQKQGIAKAGISLLLILEIVLTLLPGTHASASAAYYVDAGHCPNPGTGTLADPFCAIQTAIDVAVNGDVIYIHAGAYAGAQINGLQVTLRGYPGETTVLQAASAMQFLVIRGGAKVNLEALELDGWTGMNGGALQVAYDSSLTVTNCILKNNSADYGGAIYNEGSTSIHNTQFLSNTSKNRGGGVYNTVDFEHSRTGVMEIVDSSFLANTSTFGAGISNVGIMTIEGALIDSNQGNYMGGVENAGIYAELTVIDSEVSNNTAPVRGGGIYTCAPNTVSIVNSSIHHNKANQQGGGLYICSGPVEIINTTISDNQATNGADAGQGGGLWNWSAVSLLNVTVANNHAGETGGGLYNNSSGTVQNSILAFNTSGKDGNCGGASYGSGGYNTSTDSTCGLSGPGNQYDTDPLLGPLGKYGGKTSAYFLRKGSPAIDTASRYSCPPTDQRGETRPKDGDLNGVAICDRGALESLGMRTFQVNTTKDLADASPGDRQCRTSTGECSLRAAVQEADYLGATAQILVPPGAYLLTQSGSNPDEAKTGDLDLTGDISIEPLTGGLIMIDGNHKDRVIDLLSGNLSLKNLTIQNGLTAENGGGIRNNGALILDGVTIKANQANYGGGLINLERSSLTANNCHIDGNHSTLNGGGLFNGGAAAFIHCTIDANIADVSGDGVLNDTGSSFEFTGGSISRNDGSGLHNYSGKAVLMGSVLSNNTSDAIYTVYAVDQLLVEDCTLEGNGHYGLIHQGGKATIQRSYIGDNGNEFGEANIFSSGGNITILSSTIGTTTDTQAILVNNRGFMDLNNVTLRYTGRLNGAILADQGGVIQLTNSLLDASFASCLATNGGSIQSGGYNIETGDSCNFLPFFSDRVNTSPGLGPLLRMGTKPSHFPLLSGSPAVDTGNPWEPSENAVGTCTPLDQYGTERHAGTCDVGAVEQWKNTYLPGLFKYIGK